MDRSEQMRKWREKFWTSQLFLSNELIDRAGFSYLIGKKTITPVFSSNFFAYFLG